MGAYITMFVSRHVKKHSHIFLTGCFLVQAGFLTLAAILATFGLTPENPTGRQSILKDIYILTDIPPIATQFGIQMATNRIMGFKKLPTNVITSTYTDLMEDPDLFKLRRNPKRDRRLASVILILAGIICAAWMMKRGCRVLVQLWIALGRKVATAVGVWAFLPGVREARKEEGKAPASSR